MYHKRNANLQDGPKKLLLETMGSFVVNSNFCGPPCTSNFCSTVCTLILEKETYTKSLYTKLTIHRNYFFNNGKKP